MKTDQNSHADTIVLQLCFNFEFPMTTVDENPGSS
jgi:hypothetical protein